MDFIYLDPGFMLSQKEISVISKSVLINASSPDSIRFFYIDWYKKLHVLKLFATKTFSESSQDFQYAFSIGCYSFIRNGIFQSP